MNGNVVKTPRLTRAELRAIMPGETKVFRLEDAIACDTGKSLAYQFQHHLKCKFSIVTDYAKCKLQITRL